MNMIGALGLRLSESHRMTYRHGETMNESDVDERERERRAHQMTIARCLRALLMSPKRRLKRPFTESERHSGERERASESHTHTRIHSKLRQAFRGETGREMSPSDVFVN